MSMQFLAPGILPVVHFYVTSHFSLFAITQFLSGSMYVCVNTIIEDKNLYPPIQHILV